MEREIEKEEMIKKVQWEGNVPKDLCGNRSCFAYAEGQCDCLSDTDVGGRCPFYKTKKQLEREQREASAKAINSKSGTPLEPGDEEDDFLEMNAGLISEIRGLYDEADRIERDGMYGGDDDDDGWDDSEDGQ